MNIAKLSHKVVLCSQDDVISADGVMTLSRKDVVKTWAAIVAKSGSLFSAGYSVAEPREKFTHLISMRENTSIVITATAWIYEERLKSPPRWYKVLDIADKDDNGRFIVMKCRLVEKSDDAIKPTTDDGVISSVVQGLPPGVVL